MKNCTTCAFHERERRPDMIGADLFTCHWGPPGMVGVPFQTPQGLQMQLTSRFPPVTAGMCCHQYEPDTRPESQQNAN